jgi:hypothetical protein
VVQSIAFQLLLCFGSRTYFSAISYLVLMREVTALPTGVKGRYHADPTIQVAQCGDALLEKGDLDRMLIWLAVIRVIERLQATKPSDGETVQ